MQTVSLSSIFILLTDSSQFVRRISNKLPFACVGVEIHCFNPSWEKEFMKACSIEIVLEEVDQQTSLRLKSPIIKARSIASF